MKPKTETDGVKLSSPCERCAQAGAPCHRLLGEVKRCSRCILKQKGCSHIRCANTQNSPVKTKRSAPDAVPDGAAQPSSQKAFVGKPPPVARSPSNGNSIKTAVPLVSVIKSPSVSPPPGIQGLLRKFRDVEDAWRTGRAYTLQATTDMEEASKEVKKCAEEAAAMQAAASVCETAAKVAVEKAAKAFARAMEVDAAAKQVVKRERLMRKNLDAAMRAQDAVSTGMSEMMLELKRYGIELANGRDEE